MFRKLLFKEVLIISATRSRKYQLTINNPIDKGFTHYEIKKIFGDYPPVYYCLCDEIGENGTPHTHIYVYYENAVAFQTMKSRFPSAHIEASRGTSQENRDYIRKEGKYLESEKKETNLIETFEEYGDLPLDVKTKNVKVSEEVLEMIENGFDDYDIIKCFPSYGTKVSHLQQMRKLVIEKRNSNEWRKLSVTYIYGDTATGKTRYVMDKYGYSKVCKITNYKNPFDSYQYQDVILFDEFRSSIPITDMLQYLDGYPCQLSARYSDKTATFTKVYIISNVSLEKQYVNLQYDEPKTYNAFIRRINEIIKFTNENGNITQYTEFPEDYIITERD